MKSVLLHIFDDCGMRDRLSVALDMCRAHNAHLTCLQVMPYASYVGLDPSGGAYTSAALLEDLQAKQEQLRSQLEEDLSNEDVSWDWISCDGDVAQMIVSCSALADLVVLSQSSGPKNEIIPLPIVNEVVLHAGCPVLVVPPGMNSISATGPVAIGWNASEQAARAIRQALPMLKLAGLVHLVVIGKDQDAFPHISASSYLSRHGVASELHLINPGVRDADDVLQQFVIDKGASALLMGDYGDSRLRETLLGGVTRNLVNHAKVPLILAR
ncbi:MAG: universal stress protein [Sphingomonadales bacterium]|nr:universal stress protein [Sphingomonadales bacterium]